MRRLAERRAELAAEVRRRDVGDTRERRNIERPSESTIDRVTSSQHAAVAILGHSRHLPKSTMARDAMPIAVPTPVKPERLMPDNYRMRRSRLICRFVVLLACGGVIAGPVAVAAVAAKPTVRSLRARRGAVTVRVSTPALVRLSIYEPAPAGCPQPYCAPTLVTSTTQRVGRRGLTIEFGQALPRGRYLVVAVAFGKHGYVSKPRYATVTVVA
jgi:hypothetical protein